MSIEEYYHVFESIMYAAILTLFIQGWSKMIIHRDEYQLYWFYPIATVVQAILIIFRYFTYRTFALYKLVDTPFDFIVYVFIPVGSALLMANIIFPENWLRIDLKQHLIRQRIWIFQSPIIYCISNLIHANLTIGLSNDIILANVVGILAFLAFMITKKIRIIEIYILIAFVGLLYFLFQDSAFYQLSS